MKIRKFEKLCLVIIAALFITQTLTAQTNQPKKTAQPKAESKKVEKKDSQGQSEIVRKPHPRDEYKPYDMPEENYLARFQAIEISEALSKKNLDNIYMLKVIVTNFKEQGWKDEYDAIYADYKKAVSKFYRRQVIYSRVELEKNKQAIEDLFIKIVNVYRDQTDAMLEECANKILDFSLDEANKFDPNQSRTLFKNMMRLWIAYGQTDDATSSSIDKMYKSAVFHLRIAKSYAIVILEDLDKEIPEGKYDIHKADNMNRVMYPETAKK